MATPQAYPLGYVEDVAEVRTPLGIVFTILHCSMDDSADHPMPVIDNVDEQAAEIQFG
jgi:hypothetical protein